ncbi:MAG TPA: hypothetical protein VFA59_17905 [Vicinamibacterales bacterium]|nr:hypothetical protein [Vicinamibacterales bacterium]
MDHLVLSVNDGFDRLQRRLVAMDIGDSITATDAAEESGLSIDVCRALFAGLERAGLMSRDGDDHFVRCALDLQRT